MGNCYGSQNVLNNLTKNFLNYNIIDKDYKIIIGIYVDTNTNSNTMINQGICIGTNGNEKINKLKFGMLHHYKNKMLELYFENNIKLFFVKNKDGDDIKFVLTYNNIIIQKNISQQIIKNIKYINNNSEHIDLLLNVI